MGKMTNQAQYLGARHNSQSFLNHVTKDPSTVHYIAMKATPMILLPLKGMEDVDWSGPLKAYFASVYGTNDVFVDEINALNKLRQDVRGAGKDNIGRDLLYRYYAQLELLALRIPISEHDCRINFTWHDSFTHVANSQHSLAFEKASLLYNLACINSQIGAEADDLKVAYNRFKDAAGIFSFIISNFLHAPSTDLSQETVKALSKLMLAQAQESFVERLITEGSSSAMIPKLAKGTSNLFKGAAESLQAVFTEKGWGEKSWHQYCSVKAKYYQSVAHDQSAKNLENSGKYGNAIAHLQVAIANLSDIYKSSIPTTYVTFYDVVSTLDENMKERISTLEKENDLIYHSIVPSLASVADIPAMEAATPTPMNELYKDGQELSKLLGKELFEKVIPLSVHQQTSLYSEEKASMLRAEGEKIEIANEELSSALEFLDLPAALRAVKADEGDILSITKSQGIDPQVNDWAGQIAAESQTNGKKSSFSNLDNIKRTIYENMKKAEGLLRDEEKAYENAKAELRQALSQAPSATMNSGLLADVSRIKHDLSNASTSDDLLKNIIGACEADIQILKMGPNNPQLKKLFDDIDSQPISAGGVSLLDLDQSSNTYVDSLIDEVEDLLRNLNQLKDERNAGFVEFKERVHKDDISGILILNNKNPDIQESLFKSELGKFQPFQLQFEDSIQYQRNLLKELTMTWKKVLEDKTVRGKKAQKDELKNRRAALVARFQKAFDSWRDSQEGLNRAFDFYEKLLAFTNSTLSNSEDFVTNRREEAASLRASAGASLSQSNQELLRDQLSRLSVSSQSPRGSYSAQNDRGFTPSAPSIPATPVTPGTSAPSAIPASSGWGDLSVFENKPPAPPPKPAAPVATQAPSQPQYASYSGFAQPQEHPTTQPQLQYSYPSVPPAQAQQPQQPAYGNYAPPATQSYTSPPPVNYQTPNSYGQPQQPAFNAPAYNQPPPQQSYSRPPAQPSYPSYGSYQASPVQQSQQPQYGSYQTPPPPPPQQHQQQQYHGYNAQPQPPAPGPYNYGAPAQKDYSRMPPPPPPGGTQPQGQGYYRQY